MKNVLKDKIFLAIVFNALIFITTSRFAPAHSQTQKPNTNPKEVLLSIPERKKLREIDSKIILESIKLARFNMAFHETANKYWPWRGILYPLAKESSTALSFANAVSDLNQRGSSFGNSQKRSNAVRRRGLYTTATGKVIGGTASALELTQNGIVSLIAKRKGYSPRRSVSFVKNSRATIDELITKRDIIIDTVSEGKTKDLLKLESMLMRRIENRLVREFKRWSAHSRERMWSENVFFALDVSQNAVNFGNNTLSLGANAHPSNVRTAAILGLVAKSIATANPIVRTLAGKAVGKYQKNKLDLALPQEKIPSAEKILTPFGEEEELMELAKSKTLSDRQLEELALLVKSSQKIDDTVESEVRKIEKLRRVATQQAVSGPLIGLTGLTQKILVTVSVYDGADNDTNNKLRFAGRISQIAGQSYSLIDTPSTSILHYIKTKKLRREGQLPEQIFQRRKERLERVEKQVRGWIEN